MFPHGPRPDVSSRRNFSPPVPLSAMGQGREYTISQGHRYTYDRGAQSGAYMPPFERASDRPRCTRFDRDPWAWVPYGQTRTYEVYDGANFAGAKGDLSLKNAIFLLAVCVAAVFMTVILCSC